MDIILNTLNFIGVFILTACVFFFLSFVITYARGLAENKTKKVCDVCFRDIKKFNEYCKEHPEILTLSQDNKE